jgi:intein-encoded DNA endonuclease-like protein
MAPPDTYPLYDRIMDGTLGAWLRTARSDGNSYERIAGRLRAEHDIEVTSETVRKWCRRPDIAEPTEVGA